LLESCTMRARRAKASSPEASSGTDAGGGGGISLRFGGGAKLGGGAKFPGADDQYSKDIPPYRVFMAYD